MLIVIVLKPAYISESEKYCPFHLLQNYFFKAIEESIKGCGDILSFFTGTHNSSMVLFYVENSCW